MLYEFSDTTQMLLQSSPASLFSGLFLALAAGIVAGMSSSLIVFGFNQILYMVRSFIKM